MLAKSRTSPKIFVDKLFAVSCITTEFMKVFFLKSALLAHIQSCNSSQMSQTYVPVQHQEEPDSHVIYT